jgi:Carboxypeptidase regulatory-like domain
MFQRWCARGSISATMFLLIGQGLWAAPTQLSGRVVDENGVAVEGALITLSASSLPVPLYRSSDEIGRFLFPAVPSGECEIRVEKQGFYAFVSKSMSLREGSNALEVALNHQQEYEEKVDVVYSAPIIDREEVAVQNTLTSEQIIDIPVPATHDFRNSLPLIPGVVKDTKGRIHVNGGGEDQVLYSLDGFNITSPVSGILENRISVDAIRAVRLETSRYSAEYGKGSAGVMALESSRGDDRFRFSATNFLPSYEFHDGFGISNWNPRATVSGPLVKGRAWYFNAMALQYDLNIIDELPSTANKNRNWLGSNMTRVQVNLTDSNLLSVGLLVNFQNSRHLGITPLDPVETSRNRRERFYFFNIKDQAFLPGGWVLETGFGLNQINTRERPLGEELYQISPERRSGNYFLNSEGMVQRAQWLANVILPSWNWHGKHSVKFGIDANKIDYDQLADRRPFAVHRYAGSLAREVSFSGNPSFGRHNFEFGGFIQDRWSLNERLLVESGMRFDWDQILREPLWSPRIGATWSPTRAPDSKFSAGIGVFYDATHLDLLTRELDQQRWDTFYDEDGLTTMGEPVLSFYRANEHGLKPPFYLNWSVGWEQKLPGSFYLRSNFIRKHGRNGWSYDAGSASFDDSSPLRAFQLDNLRRDNYRLLEFTATRTFKEKYPWLLSYAYSSARSTAVIDFSLENPILGRQAGGPLDWDVPNRVISWAFLPAPFLKKYSVAYFMEWHSGFPYTVVNELQQLIGPPNGSRLPDYFSLNVHMERRFRVGRSQWALRAGFNNITGHHNPVVVNNNISSPDFRTFSGGQGRVFTGRIRFLGH